MCTSAQPTWQADRAKLDSKGQADVGKLTERYGSNSRTCCNLSRPDPVGPAK